MILFRAGFVCAMLVMFLGTWILAKTHGGP